MESAGRESSGGRVPAGALRGAAQKGKRRIPATDGWRGRDAAPTAHVWGPLGPAVSLVAVGVQTRAGPGGWGPRKHMLTDMGGH